MKSVKYFYTLIFCAASIVFAETPKDSAKSPVAEVQSEFSVEQPGSITFKTGVVIVGNVEKPQVMIFLPKEKPMYREVKFMRSFEKDAAEPIPFDPVLN